MACDSAISAEQSLALGPNDAANLCALARDFAEAARQSGDSLDLALRALELLHRAQAAGCFRDAKKREEVQ